MFVCNNVAHFAVFIIITYSQSFNIDNGNYGIATVAEESAFLEQLVCHEFLERNEANTM